MKGNSYLKWKEVRVGKNVFFRSVMSRRASEVADIAGESDRVASPSVWSAQKVDWIDILTSRLTVRDTAMGLRCIVAVCTSMHWGEKFRPWPSRTLLLSRSLCLWDYCYDLHVGLYLLFPLLLPRPRVFFDAHLLCSSWINISVVELFIVYYKSLS